MFTPSIFIALFIKRTREPDANVNTGLERVGCGIIRAPPTPKSSFWSEDASWEDLKPKSLAYLVQLFVVFHSLSLHLKSDWLQHGIIMCSIVHLAFDPNTNNWWHCGLDVTRKQQAKGEWPLAGSPRLSLEMESLSAGWRVLEFPFSFCQRLTKINIYMNFFYSWIQFVMNINY